MHPSENQGVRFVISTGSLLKAIRVIIPHLPKGAQKLMPGLLAFLPLAFEIAKLLYKYRQEIRGVIENLTTQISKQAKEATDGVAIVVPRLPKKVGRKLHRWLEYLPFTLELAKASYEKNSQKVRSLTTPLPRKIGRKINRLLKRYHRRQRLSLFHRF